MNILERSAVRGIIQEVSQSILQARGYCEYDTKLQTVVWQQVGEREWFYRDVIRIIFIWFPFVACLFTSTIEKCILSSQKALKQLPDAFTLEKVELSLVDAVNDTKLKRIHTVCQAHLTAVRKMMADGAASEKNVANLRHDLEEVRARNTTLSRDLNRLEAAQSKVSKEQKQKENFVQREQKYKSDIRALEAEATRWAKEAQDHKEEKERLEQELKKLQQQLNLNTVTHA